jgi:uncharacterized protein (DUF2062 family)
MKGVRISFTIPRAVVHAARTVSSVTVRYMVSPKLMGVAAGAGVVSGAIFGAYQGVESYRETQDSRWRYKNAGDEVAEGMAVGALMGAVAFVAWPLTLGLVVPCTALFRHAKRRALAK